MAKRKKTLVMSPIGSFVYPYLLRPDSYKGKDKYKTDIRIPNADAQNMIDKINEEQTKQKKRDEYLNDGEAVEYSDFYLPYTVDDDSGFTTFKATLNRLGNVGKADQFEQSPDIYDAEGNLVPEETKIYSGSKGRIRVEVYGWSNEAGVLGVSLRLKAAQITELASEQKKSAEDHGFSKVSGGFDATEVQMIEDEDGVDVSGREDY